MAYLNAGSEFQNPKACHCLKQIDGRLPAVESNLIRLVVVELPDREVATSEIISDIRASYPNAQVMFTASQAAMAASAGGVGVVAASPSVTDQALMHGLNAMAQRSVVSAVDARGTMHDPGAMQDMEKARKLPNGDVAKRFPPRQAQVAAGLVRGLSNKGIARELNLSESTVKVYVAAIFKALDVHSRAGAIAIILNSSTLRQEFGI